MRVKMQEIIDAMPALSIFANKELSAKAAYRIGKLVKKLNSEHRAFIEARNKAIQKHGHKITKPIRGVEQEVIEVAPENAEAFTAEMNDLLNAEVELEGVVKVAFADIEKLDIAPAVLSDLDFIIEAPIEDKKAA